MAKIAKLSVAKPAPKKRPTVKRDRDARLRAATAASLPLMGAALGWGASEALASGSMLGIIPGLMTLAVLSVSVPHVAKGLTRVLNIEAREAWSLAIAIDGAMLAAEIMLHLAGDHNPVWYGVMGLGLVGSALFNLRGFDRK